MCHATAIIIKVRAAAPSKSQLTDEGIDTHIFLSFVVRLFKCVMVYELTLSQEVAGSLLVCVSCILDYSLKYCGISANVTNNTYKK